MDSETQHGAHHHAGDHVSSQGINNRSDSDAADDRLDWGSPALSLALERVFDFFLEPSIKQRLGRTSLVARVEAMRWLVAQARGPLRGSPEFRSTVRRAARAIPLCCARFGDLYAHQWPGLAALDRSLADGSGRGSVTLMVGLPASGKSYAAIRLCPSIAQAVARASGRADAPRTPQACMPVAHDFLGDSLGDEIDRHLSSVPHGRVAVMESYAPERDEMLDTLLGRGFHVVLYECPGGRAPTPHRVIDRVLVALGRHGSSCRRTSLAEHVAALVGADPAALDALFAALRDYTYVWFEPVDGKFGPGRTVISLSCASDFETADGTTPPLDPHHFFLFPLHNA